MKCALEEIYIDGINTTVSFHLKVMEHKDFIEGNFSTSFVDNFLNHELMKKEASKKEVK